MFGCTTYCCWTAAGPIPAALSSPSRSAGHQQPFGWPTSAARCHGRLSASHFAPSVLTVGFISSTTLRHRRARRRCPPPREPRSSRGPTVPRRRGPIRPHRGLPHAPPAPKLPFWPAPRAPPSPSLRRHRLPRAGARDLRRGHGRRAVRGGHRLDLNRGRRVRGGRGARFHGSVLGAILVVPYLGRARLLLQFPVVQVSGLGKLGLLMRQIVLSVPKP